MNLRKKRVVSFLCAVLFLCAAGVYETRLTAADYSDITSDSIEQKKDEIKKAEQQQSDIKNSITDMEKLMSELENKKSDLNAYIVSIDSTMNSLLGNIASYEKLIAEKAAELADREKELEQALEQEESQYDIMQQRIQYLYEQGDTNYLEILLQADSFSSMLNRAEYVEEMAAYDNQMLHMYIAQREYIALCKEAVEAEKANLDESKNALEKEKKSLQAVRDQKAADLAAYEDDIALTEATLKELEADLAYQEEVIKSLEKEITEEQKAILAEKGVTLGYGGNGFACPAPSYTRISSEFGWRTDPFTGLKAYHNGIDMAAAEGTPIVAAYDGIVGQAGYNSSMGNYIYIEHGDGLRTIYLHASKLYVEKDDVVLKGDVIGAVGTTGRSTGPHLHFSVRLNGEYVSPWNYLSK